MSRSSISINTVRQLWSQCGGYCQNPECNQFLFRTIGNDVVSLANIAHIIGAGKNGPRSDHELADYVGKNGESNLIMLCLVCHKIIDELERRFPVEVMQSWKQKHKRKIEALFGVPHLTDETEILEEVNNLLEINGLIFSEYGPYSNNLINGTGGDGLIVWRKRCLDTIIPNNQRIIALIERNKNNFSRSWDVYIKMQIYKLHSDAFQDNCLTNQKVNDYKLFPRAFDHFVKTKLGIASHSPDIVDKEELEYRNNQLSTLVDRFLHSHNQITDLAELNKATMLVKLRDGRELKVFVTNTYYFTDYTLDRALEIDPAINAIICSSPSGTYSLSAKQTCIELGIGLFMLGEFMGAINFSGDQYLNFLLRSQKENRISKLKESIKNSSPPAKIKVFGFGSFLRRLIHTDVDIFVVYHEPMNGFNLKLFEEELKRQILHRCGEPDITFTSEREFGLLSLNHDNLMQVYP